MRYQVLTALFIATFAVATAFGQGGGTGFGTGTGITAGNQGGGGLGQFGAGGQGGSIGGILQNQAPVVEGNGFLGRTNSDGGFLTGGGTAAGGNNRNTGNFGNAGGFAGGGRAGGAGGRGGQPQQQSSTRVIRTRITIPRDFGRVIVPVARVQSRLNGQFRRASSLGQRARRTFSSSSSVASRVNTNGLRGSNVVATPSGRTVTLSGSVMNDRDRLIAEKMAKMEPGVDVVVNQIVVSN